jgi:hypothetical protein
MLQLMNTQILLKILKPYSGVQRINNVFHIVDKVENVLVYTYIFNLNDNVEYVVYALYSSIVNPNPI